MDEEDAKDVRPPPAKQQAIGQVIMKTVQLSHVGAERFMRSVKSAPVLVPLKPVAACMRQRR